MRKYALSLAIALAMYEIPFVLSAQTDSSRYDIGNGTLDKAFTQHVSIRGEDLEKMPFTNLADAIRAWLFGVYTQPGTLSYVVDGNPVVDVNSYPIFEIEEVTFIDNAVGTAGYGNSQEELVLITTKRGKGKGGVRVVGQTGLVKGNFMGADSYTRQYHHYYIGANRNLDKVSFGVSADWQRDVAPEFKTVNEHVNTPYGFERWRFNGYFDWRPDNENTIEVQMNYTPQLMKVSLDSADNYYAYSILEHIPIHMLVPSVSWDGHWGAGLRNKFFAGYLGVSSNEQLTQTDSEVNYGFRYTTLQSKGKFDHIFLRDRLSYEAVAGKWRIVPAVNLSWQHIDEKSNVNEIDQITISGSLPSTSTYTEEVEEKGSLFYITPAVDLSLARAFNIQAGLIVNASHRTDTGNRRLFPFVTATVDLLHLNNAVGGNSLKLFGSYARRASMFPNDYALPDFSSNGGSQSLFTIYHYTGGYYYNGGQQVSQNSVYAKPEPGYWTWNAGAAFSTADGRVMVQYSYERRSFSFADIDNSGYWSYEPWTASFHHADMRFKLVDTKAVSWVTGVNVSLIRAQGDTAGFQANSVFPTTPEGDVSPAKLSWTGGWVNRLRFGGFTAGLDLLYHLSYTSEYTGYPKNAFALPNVYAGYGFSLPHARALDIFLESRGLVMNNPTDLEDRRRYYTLGASITF